MITTAERACAVDLLRARQEFLLAAIAGFRPDQWSFRPDAETWSALDCVEHLAIIEAFIFRAVQRTVSQPADPAKRKLAEGKDATILRAVPARERRVTAPEPVRPTGLLQPHEALEKLAQSRNATIAFAETTELELRDFVFPHPFLKEMDCYQWLLFLAVHQERHTHQIEELKQAPGFPA